MIKITIQINNRIAEKEFINEERALAIFNEFYEHVTPSDKEVVGNQKKADAILKYFVQTIQSIAKENFRNKKIEELRRNDNLELEFD